MALGNLLCSNHPGGGVLLLAAITALVIAKSAFGPSFESFWTTTVGLRFGATVWEHSLRHWINDGLVTLFFFVVGLEIKRELVSGELSEPRVAALPVITAAGGMVVPAALYLALASGPQAGRGWGVVMATDIAFVVGCLALLGSRVPNSLKIFVLALAIIDDIGAILVIALGYSHAFHAMPLAGALLGLGITVLMQWLGVRAVMAYWLVGLLTWAALHESGIHPTIAGVALGLLTPVTALVDPNRLDWFLTWARHAAPVALEETEAKPKAVRQRLARAVKESISPQQRLEAGVHPWSAFFVLPVFALANAGVAISIASAFNPNTLAIIVGLTVGKPLGIFAFAWFAVEFGLARKPEDITWLMLLAAGLLAGIGFTMALFIANLAFQGDALEAAKLGILTASLISGVVGMVLLRTLSVKKSSSC
jgi:Na+:H+ antiporter, NhaA family